MHYITLIQIYFLINLKDKRTINGRQGEPTFISDLRLYQC